jgi:hypothetical protein
MNTSDNPGALFRTNFGDYAPLFPPEYRAALEGKTKKQRYKVVDAIEQKGVEKLLEFVHLAVDGYDRKGFPNFQKRIQLTKLIKEIYKRILLSTLHPAIIDDAYRVQFKFEEISEKYKEVRRERRAYQNSTQNPTIISPGIQKPFHLQNTSASQHSNGPYTNLPQPPLALGIQKMQAPLGYSPITLNVLPRSNSPSMIPSSQARGAPMPLSLLHPSRAMLKPQQYPNGQLHPVPQSPYQSTLAPNTTLPSQSPYPQNPLPTASLKRKPPYQPRQPNPAQESQFMPPNLPPLSQVSQVATCALSAQNPLPENTTLNPDNDDTTVPEKDKR